jgi:hypothetical protein
MKEKKLLKIQPLPKVLLAQAIRATKRVRKNPDSFLFEVREETTQDTIVTKSAAFASYEINYLTYITATYTRAKRRWHGAKIHHG